MKKSVIIISGLPRSGTSMLMQALIAGGMAIATDGKREPDQSNPKGYLEIESIIDKLRDNPEFIFNFEGQVVKVIAYGLQFLPPGNYKIIYMDRNIEEVLDSMEKMADVKDEEREATKAAFMKLNEKTKLEIRQREDVDVLFISYNEILSDPRKHLQDVYEFLADRNLDFERMVEIVDQKLYRQRRMEE